MLSGNLIACLNCAQYFPFFIQQCSRLENQCDLSLLCLHVSKFQSYNWSWLGQFDLKKENSYRLRAFVRFWGVIFVEWGVLGCLGGSWFLGIGQKCICASLIVAVVHHHYSHALHALALILYRFSSTWHVLSNFFSPENFPEP